MARLWMIHGPEVVDFDPIEIYANEDTMFSIKMFHGGEFINCPGRKYVGKFDYIDMVSTEDFGQDVLVEILKSLGYPVEMVYYFHFKLPDLDLDKGLRVLAYKSSIERLCSLVSRFKVIEIYIEHWQTKVDTFLIEHMERQQQVEVECSDDILHVDLDNFDSNSEKDESSENDEDFMVDSDDMKEDIDAKTFDINEAMNGQNCIALIQFIN
ncbi:hypothetical protein QVD17_10629 [Tagetes erecta]|uniref:PB1-like domain-containing protein n=1 Tax=Tagetes erecta TaxID=13708 RepID=A0AAD8P645_TARER|nr:hypothetical protein QVD17_10629 [Tagetes erecta]